MEYKPGMIVKSKLPLDKYHNIHYLKLLNINMLIENGTYNWKVELLNSDFKCKEKSVRHEDWLGDVVSIKRNHLPEWMR